MTVIKTENLTKKYKDITAVDNLNLEIKNGELFALLGTNGAGKTTTIKMLTSLTEPSTGKVVIMGFETGKENGNIRKIINVSPQETAIAPNLTVMENLRFIAGVYGVGDDKILQLIKDFSLDKILNQKTKTLSGGWQRRLSIALALINNPKILFLDEPTLGLDVIARKELWDIINSLKGKITIILTTHYMEEAAALADRVGIMADGIMKSAGTVKELLELTGAESLEKAFIEVVTGENK